MDVWRVITPPKRTRAFICGATGSGKSSLGASLLRAYSRFYPLHHRLILDPKRRFFPRWEGPEAPLFPDGIHAVNHGRRDGVTVNARLLRDIGKWPMREVSLLVQDYDLALAAMRWLYRNADVRRPWMVYIDESQEFQANHQAALPLRTLLQQGREIGVGIIAIHQRPKWLDVGHISEAQRLYVGSLNVGDLKHLASMVTPANAALLKVPPEQYTFMMINQVAPKQSFAFRLPA